jgi:hypothetical protein
MYFLRIACVISLVTCGVAYAMEDSEPELNANEGNLIAAEEDADKIPTPCPPDAERKRRSDPPRFCVTRAHSALHNQKKDVNNDVNAAKPRGGIKSAPNNLRNERRNALPDIHPVDL